MSVYLEQPDESENERQDVFDFEVYDLSLWFVSEQAYPGPPNPTNPLAVRFAA